VWTWRQLRFALQAASCPSRPTKRVRSLRWAVVWTWRQLRFALQAASCPVGPVTRHNLRRSPLSTALPPIGTLSVSAVLYLANPFFKNLEKSGFYSALFCVKNCQLYEGSDCHKFGSGKFAISSDDLLQWLFSDVFKFFSNGYYSVHLVYRHKVVIAANLASANSQHSANRS
jgi:hypothetical protein